MRRTSPRRWRHGGLAFLVAIAGALILAAAAVAYWTSAGAGAGSGTTETPLAIVLSAGTPSGELYPGGSADVAVLATNPNPFSLRLGSLSLDTSRGSAGFAVDVGHASCDLGALSFTAQNNGGAGWTIPPRVGAVNGSIALDLTAAVAMDTSAVDACQGASFVVHLSAGVS